MTHMAEIGRMQASGRCSSQWGCAVPGGDGPSAGARIAPARTFSLRYQVQVRHRELD